MRNKQFMVYLLGIFISTIILIVYLQYNSGSHINKLIDGNESLINEFQIIGETQKLQKNATIVFALPKEYRFNSDYKFIRFKVYAPAKSTFTSPYEPFQRLWQRFMNYMWAFSGESNFGQEYWDLSADDFKISDANLQKWTDVTIDLSRAKGKHNRVFVLNIGGEPNINFNANSNITYYFSDFRFSKT